jgi:hypothetical protein
VGNAWIGVEHALLTHFHQPDIEAARVLYAAFAAHKLSGPPVWPMIVAPPGSMKTELLNALVGQKGTHFIDQITPNTFISGQIERPNAASKDPPGLLHRIGASGVIVFSDFGNVLAMPVEKRAGILADMRRIYDGSLHKEFGTATKPGHREWKGRITFFVAATPDVDRHYSIFQTLGERFVMVRCHRAEGTEAAMAAMRQDTSGARGQLRRAVHDLLAGVLRIEPQSPDDIDERIAALAELVVRGRTHVQRDGYKKEIRFVPEAEAPTRLAQQLSQLSKGSAMLDCRDIVDAGDYKLVRRVGMDCIPAARRKILEYLTTGEESTLTGLPASTRSYAEEELAALGLISGSASSAELSTEALMLMSRADLL